MQGKQTTNMMLCRRVGSSLNGTSPNDSARGAPDEDTRRNRTNTMQQQPLRETTLSSSRSTGRRRTDGSSMILSLLLVLLVVAQQVKFSACTEDVPKDDLDFYVMPSIDEITFFNHAFVTPGILNLENLSFETKEELDQFGNSLTKEFVLDIVEFRAEEICNNEKGCGNDWSQYAGVGVFDNATMHWCCTPEAISKGYCDSTQENRLILLDEDSDGNNGSHRSEYDIYHRTILVPEFGNTKDLLHDAQLHRLDGKYVVLFANCNPNGRPVHVTGTFDHPVTATIPESVSTASPKEQTSTSAPSVALTAEEPCANCDGDNSTIYENDEILEVTEEVQFQLEPSDTVITAFQRVYPEDGIFVSELSFFSAQPGDETWSDSVVDFVEFHSDECDGQGCDLVWHEAAGIGAILEGPPVTNGGTKKVQFCCTQDAIDQDLCNAADVGKLIIEKKEGVFHRSIDILSTGEVEEIVKNWESYRNPGEHVVIMAHCNPNGRPLHVLGFWNFRLHGSDAPTASPVAIPSVVPAPDTTPAAKAPQTPEQPASSESRGYLDSDTDGRSWTTPLAWGLLGAAILIVCFVAINRYMYERLVVVGVELSTKRVERVASRQNMLVDFSIPNNDDRNGIDDILEAFDEEDDVGLDFDEEEGETVEKPLPAVT